MSTEQLVQDNTAFAIQLYQQLKGTDGNLFFSPYSISTALAMTYAGARGKTGEQMASTLHFSLPPAKLHPAFSDLARQIQAAETGEIRLKIANALWPQTNYPFLQAYLELVRANYGEQVTPLNYANSEAARQVINAWVEAQTEAKIKELIPPGFLNPLVRLVLTNAIYFKGSWSHPFKPEHTQAMPFQIDTDHSVETACMRQKGEFGYSQQSGLQILELPYENGALSMVIFLPRADELANLEAKLTSKNLESWLGRLFPNEVEIYLPRFKFSASFFLNEALQSLGMTEAFNDQRADFSGMDGIVHWLYISAVLHKAFVEVNEAGTEAAAATAVVMKLRAMPEKPAVFRTDHPFLFLIRENTTGSILFLGRVTNPTLEE